MNSIARPVTLGEPIRVDGLHELPCGELLERYVVANLTNLLRAGAVAAALLFTTTAVPAAAAQTTADRSTDRDHDGFDNWGLLGLLGLAGLLGRKRERTVVEPRRV
jgi:hypothetical protein